SREPPSFTARTTSMKHSISAHASPLSFGEASWWRASPMRRSHPYRKRPPWRMYLYTTTAANRETMRKLMASAYKEVLLLLRDWGGLAILFFMPAVLIITITLIQESTFKAVGESTLPIVLVDNDSDEIGRIVASNLREAPNIQVVTE